MNPKYYSRVENFSIVKSQELAIKKATELGIKLSAIAFDSPYSEGDEIVVENLNKFGYRFFEIFGEDAEKYIYSLESPFDNNEWYTINYYEVDGKLISSDYSSINYGFKNTLGLIVNDIESLNLQFSSVDLREDGADFYINGQIFAKVSKTEFSEVSQTDLSEITTLLKGIHTGREFTTDSNIKKLAKLPWFENYLGHKKEKYGSFVCPSISNFVRGFQWLIQSFTDEKISLNVAEKVMWAFFEIENEHVLRANENKKNVLAHPYLVIFQNDDQTMPFEYYYYRSIQESLLGFRQKIKEYNITASFALHKPSFGNMLEIRKKENASIFDQNLLSMQSCDLSIVKDEWILAEDAERLLNGELHMATDNHGNQEKHFVISEHLKSLVLNHKELIHSIEESTTSRAEEVIQWKKEGKILLLDSGRDLFFPIYQFDEDGKPLPSIQTVLEVFADKKSDFKTALWFISANSWLNGQAPMDVVATDPDKVIAAAKEEIRPIDHG